MRETERGLGVPDFGHGISRLRLLHRVESAGNCPCLIVGASGSGKSFLAAQLARQRPGSSVWLPADGTALSPAELMDLLRRVLKCSRSGVTIRRAGGASSDYAASFAGAVTKLDDGDGVCVVIDDFGEPNSDTVEFLQRVADILWRAGSRLVITARTARLWPSDVRCRWLYLDAGDLSLDSPEAMELARDMGLGLSAERVEDAWQASSGHVALFCALSSQSARYGLGRYGVRVATLESWLDRVVGELDPSALHMLVVASSLGRGTEVELRGLGIDDARRVLLSLSEALPLIRATEDDGGRFAFVVHDIVDTYLFENCGACRDCELNSLLALLSERGDHGRACELLLRRADHVLAHRWLQQHGIGAFEAGHISSLHRLLESTSLTALMSDAKTLVLWARVCGEMGQYGESLAKAKAARLLSEHEHDGPTVREAIAQVLMSLRLLGRQEEADRLAEEVAGSRADYVDDRLVAEALYCIGAGRVSRGELVSAEAPLRAVLELCGSEPEARPVSRLAQNALAVFPGLVSGDFRTSRRLLARMLDSPGDTPSLRVMVKGNLAQFLLECGRTERAESIARAVLAEARAYGQDLYVGAYLPTLGAIRLVTGDPEGGIADIRAGIALSRSAGDITESAINRVFLSLALRAAGRASESLDEAEHALDDLSARNSMGFARIAALEVGASFLAAGDLVTAREWAGSSPHEDANPFLSLRAALTLSECDRLEGDLDGAVARLSAHEDYIRSENPNLLIAMYCRAFPSIMSTLARAVGTEALPAHMLRMIPPENAEVVLTEARVQLDEPVWKDLGLRILGEEEFGRFLLRDGLPVLHVRFFGGLEVSVGGRAIREKDWHKRKARLLFAMLILRRGQDVPRDQLFEYLFPDMDPERAKNNLYVLWSTMKSVIMGEGCKGVPFPYFEALGGVCRSVRDNVRCDVDDFDRLLRHAREHEAAGELAAAITHYERLSSLYRGDLLPGDVYDDWFAELRDSYRITFVNAMLTAGEILMNADDPGNALVFARRAIQTDPLREDLYQVALRCQIAAGQRSGAIDTYLQCRAKLSEDLGLDPSAETKALYQQILAMEDRPRIIPLDPFVE